MAVNSKLGLLLAFTFAPALASAQAGSRTETALCLDLSPTTQKEVDLNALLTDESFTSKLTTNNTDNSQAPFIGKKRSGERQLCYGPFHSDPEAALAAVRWQQEQPFFSANVRVEGFILVKAPSPLPEKKGDVKLGDAIDFDPATADFAQTFTKNLPGARLGAIGPDKAYAFGKPDAWLPAKKGAVAELTQGKPLLTLGQERWCEESAGCLFWEKTLLGEHHKIAYIPAGYVVYGEEGIPAPDGSWTLFVRPRGTLPYTPGRFNEANGTGTAEPSVVVDLWAKNDKNEVDSLGTVEIPGSSTAGLAITFTPDGVLFQDSQHQVNKAFAFNTSKYPTVQHPTNDTAVAEAKKASETTLVSTKPTGTAAKKKKTYTVRSGDSLWDISQKYGCTVEQLRKANKLSKKSVLQPGQKLVIP